MTLDVRKKNLSCFCFAVEKLSESSKVWRGAVYKWQHFDPIYSGRLNNQVKAHCYISSKCRRIKRCYVDTIQFVSSSQNRTKLKLGRFIEVSWSAILIRIQIAKLFVAMETRADTWALFIIQLTTICSQDTRDSWKLAEVSRRTELPWPERKKMNAGSFPVLFCFFSCHSTLVCDMLQK